MPRARRFYNPGYVWHITHRCHKKEFLLKLAKDRRRWLHWLFEAKKRYKIQILNYMVTLNHIHLLVYDDGSDAISRAMQLAAGRTAQEYNDRKKRKGAFWEDRYHATAVESGVHLNQCIAYIDTNMLRAGKVRHPSQWSFCGYAEIHKIRRRKGLTNVKLLADLLGVNSLPGLRKIRDEWIDGLIEKRTLHRQRKWTEAIAVGSKRFVEETKVRLGVKTRWRKIRGEEGAAELRELRPPYPLHFTP